MRRLVRPELSSELAAYLDHQQQVIDGGADVERTWRGQRQSLSMQQVARLLARMTGARERCMFCEDSRGTDVDHFRPRSYREAVFQWLNFLWLCAGCNRCKGDRFPRDGQGRALLIDPTAEDPWNSLFFDPETGEITARWDPVTGLEDPKGLATLTVLARSLRHEAVTEGRRRARRNLSRAVRRFLSDAGRGDVREEMVEELLESLKDNDEYGLAFWFFVHDGRSEPPFEELKNSYPHVWERIVALLAQS